MNNPSRSLTYEPIQSNTPSVTSKPSTSYNNEIHYTKSEIKESDCELNAYVQLDCSDLCKNASKGTCTNSALSQRNFVRTYISESKLQGEFGLYTKEKVNEGDCLGEYTGETMTSQQAITRIGMRQGGRYMMQVTPTHYVDAQEKGSPLRFVNHACGTAANVRCKVVTVIRANGSNELCLGFYAKEEIAKNTELFLDYTRGYHNHMTREMNLRGLLNGDCQCMKCQGE
jgi:hypothetical protein